MKHLGHIHDNYSTLYCQESFILKLMNVKGIIKKEDEFFIVNGSFHTLLFS